MDTIRILIVDNDPAVRQLCVRHLIRRAHFAVAATDGSSVKHALPDHVPHIVIAEMMMPEKDGVELLLDIKRWSPRTKVILTSSAKGALTLDFLFHVARRLGADATLTKPFDADQLDIAIDSVLRPPFSL